MKTLNTNTKEQGAALISVLMGVLVTAILALVFATAFKNQNQALSIARQRGQLIDLRQLIRIS